MPPSLPFDRTNIKPGDRLCAAVSGGADSVALLLTLHAANATPRESLGVGLSAVHIHHGLRGKEADTDQHFVKSLCAHLDIPLHLHQASVPDRVAETHETIEEAARAIMTTDTVPKQVALHHPGNWTVGGMTKGAGMLAPSLATMLCVLTTDAVADASALEQALRRATALTFDRLDVDGSCSTNDTVLLLASGASEIAPSQADLDDAVLRVCDDLCAQLQADAEGVTKRITISVTGAASEDDAVTAARVIARDSLVKTALFGSDANWGRVLAAVGMAPVELDPDRITVSFNGSAVCVDGVGTPGAREVDLSATDIEVAVDLGVGAAQAAIRTTDLSHAYVEENSAYSS